PTTWMRWALVRSRSAGLAATGDPSAATGSPTSPSPFPRPSARTTTSAGATGSSATTVTTATTATTDLFGQRRHLGGGVAVGDRGRGPAHGGQGLGAEEASELVPKSLARGLAVGDQEGASGRHQSLGVGRLVIVGG